jgi:hypothetical protein
MAAGAGAGAGPTAEGRPGRAPRGAAPAAPWSPFPLIELAILVALVLIGVGLATHGGRGGVLVACGLGLVTVATLELTVREHFAGYRSHASLLAGAGSVASAVVLYAFTELPQPVPLAVAAAVFGTLWRLLRGAYRRACASTGVEPTPGPTVPGGRRARLR